MNDIFHLNILSIMPVMFIPIRPQRFHVGTAAEISYIDLGEVCVFKIHGLNSIVHFGVKHGIGAQTLVFGQEAQTIYIHPFGAA